MRPLDGIRVLDFTHVLAGPFATRVLGDMGADVVKVNTASREGANGPGTPYYLMWNRNKRALALDMAKEASRPVCRQLCERADVVIDNFSPGVLERWGVGFEAISAVNPGVIYVQMSGMGSDGPWAHFVTYAPTIHALAGLTQLTGVPGREDIGIGFSYNDHQAGLHGAVAILAALAARRRTGRGQRVDLSQFEVGVNLAGPALLDYFANGRTAAPVGNRLPYDAAAPHGCFPCLAEAPTGVATTERGAQSASVNATANERWVAIACLTDSHWFALRRAMGEPEWAQDAALNAAQGRVAMQDELEARIAAWTQTQTAEDVMKRCQAAGAPAGVVQTGVDLAERDPQLAASRFLMEMRHPHPTAGRTWADRLPIEFEGTPCDQYERVRDIGEDNASVLADWLGMSAADVRRGEDEGVFR